MPFNRSETKEVSASSQYSVAVTPSDTTILKFKALYIGGAGNVAIKHNSGDTAVTFTSVPAGTILPIQTGEDGGLVMSTNTTATNIVAMDW